MCRRKARLSLSAEDVGCNNSGLFRTLSVRIRVAVSGEWARERSLCAGCEMGAAAAAVVVVDGFGEEVMVVARRSEAVIEVGRTGRQADRFSEVM